MSTLRCQKRPLRACDWVLAVGGWFLIWRCLYGLLMKFCGGRFIVGSLSQYEYFFVLLKPFLNKTLTSNSQNITVKLYLYYKNNKKMTAFGMGFSSFGFLFKKIEQSHKIGTRFNRHQSSLIISLA